MALQVNLNADMGEGFGAWDIGADSELLDVITSANVACGFHAGDPNVMNRVVRQAKAKGVSIGAHPGFNDLWGFGRRAIVSEPADIEHMIAYQLGALIGICNAAAARMTHVKPHGALNNMAATDRGLADAIARSIKAVDPTLIFVAPTGSEMCKAALDIGLPMASEVFADRTYDDQGNLTSRKKPNAMIHEPEKCVEHVVRMVKEGVVISTSGKRVPVKAHSICVHGDGPHAVETARAVRRGLEQAGIAVVPLPAMQLS